MCSQIVGALMEAREGQRACLKAKWQSWDLNADRSASSHMLNRIALLDEQQG